MTLTITHTTLARDLGEQEPCPTRCPTAVPARSLARSHVARLRRVVISSLVTTHHSPAGTSLPAGLRARVGSGDGAQRSCDVGAGVGQ